LTALNHALGNNILRQTIKYIIILLVYLLLATLTLQVSAAEAPNVETNPNDMVLEAPFALPTLKVPSHKQYAYYAVKDKWGVKEWNAFDKIITKESNWNHLAQNPTSTVYGYAQFLNSTWGLVGCKKTSDPDEQIRCAILYIETVYGSPQKAWSFHLQNNWY